MKFIKYSTLIAFVFIISSVTHAQTETPPVENNPSLSNGTIDSQFEYLLKRSGNFRGTNNQMYEAVRLSMLLKLKANTIDSLKTAQKSINTLENTVTTQQKEIEGLKRSLSTTQTTLDATKSEKNSMAFFGAHMSKTSYNILMWLIIGSLLALLIFFFLKFKNSNAITKKAKQSLAEIEDEFEEHRRIALEREQKVRRQLQDEINKQKKGK